MGLQTLVGKHTLVESISHSHKFINLISYPILHLRTAYFPRGLPIEFYTPFLSPLSAICIVYLEFQMFITLTTRGNLHKSRNFSLCNILNCSLISSFLGPNILQIILFSNKSNEQTTFQDQGMQTLILKLSLNLGLLVYNVEEGIAQSALRWTTSWTVMVRFPAGARIFLFSTTSESTPGPTQPLIQWVPGLFPRGKATGS
jgi:hypothetical protein